MKVFFFFFLLWWLLMYWKRVMISWFPLICLFLYWWGHRVLSVGSFVLSLRCLATCGGILNPCQSHKPMRMKEAWHELIKVFCTVTGCIASLWCMFTWVGLVESVIVALWLCWDHGPGRFHASVCWGKHVQWCYVVALHGLDHRQVNVQCALLVFKARLGCLCGIVGYISKNK